MPTVTRSKSKEDTIMTEQLLASMQSMQASIATMNQSVMDLTNSVGQLRIDMDGIKDSVKFNQNEQKEFKNAIKNKLSTISTNILLMWGHHLLIIFKNRT